ncbi:lipopolysaccharide heptosyltransferase I [Achromobacter sp. HNDS-1]|jgi:heptosyltransferase I|uniref:Lipopolysaccharide heptosyltransferase 1 n=2 Tax=Achromobacter TaxID=222 RepID=A0AAU7LHZ8_9BURK|nr:lipopolysaccharide heptosyltransferase I [Achromobacter ruhlandii]PJM68070.1 lipopolysaccharide heptosyltransferase I [Achromobacter ruhlandii]
MKHPRILIVRTSSLGDLVHMLPAISDIVRHVPEARISWIVEEAFAEIPSWHPGVHEVIKVAHRRWRKSWWSPEVRAERKALAQRLRAEEFDIILDMQALLKSAWLVRQTRGVKHGLDWRSAREPLASLFYNVRHRVEFWQPAVIRQRKLAALTFGYSYSGHPDFGLQEFCRQSVNPPAEDVSREDHGHEVSRVLHLDTSQDYAVIMPSASRDDKLWPEDDWRAVFRRLRDAGCALKLLAGNDREAERAKLLVAGMEDVEVMPRMDLTSVARLLAGARLMVGLDSGLTHLSAALGRPTIGIYRASTPVRTPLVGSNYTASLGDRGASPSREAVMASVEQALAAR